MLHASTLNSQPSLDAQNPQEEFRAPSKNPDVLFKIEDFRLKIERQPMDSRELCDRTRQFALRIIRLVAALPKNRIADVLGRQLLRSGTSVGANYREAVRVVSRKHFASNIAIVLRQADETLYWLELLSESGLVDKKLLADLTDECSQLVAIFAATLKTARRKPTDV